MKPIKRIRKALNGPNIVEEDEKLPLRLFLPPSPDSGDSFRSVKFGYVSKASPHGRAFVSTHWMYQDENLYLRDLELFSRLEQLLIKNTICFHVPYVIDHIERPDSSPLEIALAFHGRNFETALNTRILRSGFDFISIFLQLSWFIYCLYDTTPEAQFHALDFTSMRFSVQLAPCDGFFLFKYILPISSTESKVLSLTTRVKVTITALPKFGTSFFSPVDLSDIPSKPPSPSSSSLSATPPIEMSANDRPPVSKAKRTRSGVSRREARADTFCVLDEMFRVDGFWKDVVMSNMPATHSVFKLKNGKVEKMLIFDFFLAFTPAPTSRRSGRESWLDIREMMAGTHCADKRQYVIIQTINQSPPTIDGQDPLLLQQREQWVSEVEAPVFDLKGSNESSEEDEILIQSKSRSKRATHGHTNTNRVQEHPTSAIEAHLAPLNAPTDQSSEQGEKQVFFKPNLPFPIPCDTTSIYIAPSSISDICSPVETSEEESVSLAGLFTGGIGLGIYAAKFIPARTILTCYTGHIVSRGFVDRTKGNFFNTHLITASYSMSTQYDGLRYPQPGQGVASLINSTIGVNGKKMRGHNACFDDIKGDSSLKRRKVIRTIHDIQPGEEILISYVWI